LIDISSITTYYTNQNNNFCYDESLDVLDMISNESLNLYHN